MAFKQENKAEIIGGMKDNNIFFIGIDEPFLDHFLSFALIHPH